MTLTDSFLEGIDLYCGRTFSPEEIHQVKRCLLDWVGVAAAGGKLVADKVTPLLASGGEGPCSLFIPQGGKADLRTAATVNALAGHEIELDDGNRFGMIHIGSVVMTAMVAIAQKESLSFDDFVKGVLTGYQCAVSLSRYSQPFLKKNGYHATGTCGTVAVACAVSMAMHLSDEQMRNAVSGASVRSSGLMQWLDSPSEYKSLSAAGAVDTGIVSAYLAKGGFKGASDPLGGKRGFVSVLAKGCEPHDFDWSPTPEILNIYFKPYVSCRHCHAPAEGAMILAKEYGFSYHDVESVQVDAYKLAIDGHDSQHIDSPAAGKMSIPYCVAVSIFLGSCGMEAFSEEMVSNPEVASLTRKVSLREDPELTRISSRMRSSIVTVFLKGGESFSRRVDYPLGEPENPMTDNALEEKYMDLMRFAGKDPERAQSILKAIRNLENDFDEFLKLI